MPQWLWINFQSVLSLVLVCTGSGCNLLPWRQKHELVDSQTKINEAFVSNTWGEDYEMQFQFVYFWSIYCFQEFQCVAFNFHTQYEFSADSPSFPTACSNSKWARRLSLTAVMDAIPLFWLYIFMFSFLWTFLSGFITRTTTTSSPSFYLAPLCWRNLPEHSWASTSAEERHHNWESLYPRFVVCVCVCVCVWNGFYCIRTCVVAENLDAFQNFKNCDFSFLCIVCLQVVPDSDAHRAGLQEGDQVLCVNEVDFQDIEHSRVSQSIKSSTQHPPTSIFLTLRGES